MAEKSYLISSIKSVRGDPELLSGIVDGSIEEIKAETYEGATKIGTYLFYKNPNLKSISIPASVTSIEDYAISNCKSLESVTLNGPLNYIGIECFDGANSSLYNIYENIEYIGLKDNPYYAPISPSAYIKTLKIHKDCEIIPSNFGRGSTYISERAESIEFEEGSKLKHICKGAFSNCRYLKSFIFPENLETCDGYIIDYYSNLALEEVTFLNNNPINFTTRRAIS